MTMENKSSRTLVNLIGVPSLLAIIVVGDSFQNLPLFSIFIGVVLYLGALEIKTLVKENLGEEGSLEITDLKGAMVCVSELMTHVSVAV